MKDGASEARSKQIVMLSRFPNILNRDQHLSFLFIVHCSLLIVSLFTVSCDHGLGPVEAKSEPGFGGTIRVVSPWPPADSLHDLRVVAFRTYPPTNILDEVVNGRAVFSQTLPYNVAEQSYTFTSPTMSGTFEYVVVAWQYGSLIDANWRVAAVYSVSGDQNTPSPITINGRFIPDVNLTVDFYNLPPQPF